MILKKKITQLNKSCICALLLLASTQLYAQVSLTGLKCEYQAAPIGITSLHPHLSWLIVAKQRNSRQTAYRVIVADDTLAIKKNKGTIWDSGKMLSDQSIRVEFRGTKLESVKTYYWKVMVWDNHGGISAWSKSAKWQTGLFNESDWMGAKWIGYEKLPDSLLVVPAITDPTNKDWNKGNDILPLMRKELIVKKPIKEATIFITGLGQFDLSINGEKVGDHFMDPGWTKYDKHALYVTFDITGKLREGKNALGVMLGNGFYYVPGDRYHKLKEAFGYPKMICRIAIKYMDGTDENIISDRSWKTAPGPVTFSSIYGGEDYNANLKRNGWNRPGYNDRSWRQVITVDGPAILDPQTEEPLRIFENFAVKKITHPKPGVWVYDMGQNASAIPSITVSGQKGSVIKITPAELLYDNGLVNQSAVGAPVYFNYTLDGEGTESWHPQFMYYGFRYIQVEGGVPVNEPNPDKMPVIKKVESLHTRNSAAVIGKFYCSNDLFNKTFNLIDWAIQSNMSSLFTDCPHREKLGWLEEAHLVGSSILYNYDIATLCRKVVHDMEQSQTKDGLIPDIAPEYAQFDGGFRDSPEWGSNGIIMPYYIYQWYGDKQVLEESYNMMKRYAAYLDKKSKDHLLYFGLGDWYDIGPRDLGPSQLTPRGLTSTAVYYYDLTILTKVAHILNKLNDEKAYTDLSKQVKINFNKTFFNKQTYQYGSGSQTSNAMPVYMGLVDSAVRIKVVDNIIKDIRNHNNGITAGDIGYRYLLRVLDDAGRSDVIFDMNSRSDVPGYGYQIAHGATALTESWQGNRISSNNHFMLGHLMEWFYSGLGGIKPAVNSIAFHEIDIRPEPVGDVKNATASYLSPYGFIKNKWERTDKLFKMDTQIPPNTTAVIYLPANKTDLITEGGKKLRSRRDVKLIRYEEGKAIIKIGSGKYSFMVKSM